MHSRYKTQISSKKMGRRKIHHAIESKESLNYIDIKVDFKVKNITRNKESHFITIKGSIHINS